MRLSQLRKPWQYMSESEKLDLIEKTNERRIEAFETKISKRRTSTPKKVKGKASRKSPKTPQDLAKLMLAMSPEERENFKLMLNMTSND